MTDSLLAGVKGVVVDMDGVLWVGERPLPGLEAFFALLRERRLPYVLATNNASRSPGFYVRKLSRMGVRIDERSVLTSALAAADWLTGELPRGAPVYVVGQEGLRHALSAAGFAVVETAVEPAGEQVGVRGGPTADPGPRQQTDDDPVRAALPRATDRIAAVSAVVVGIDFDVTYRVIRDAVLLIRRGALFVGTNGDLTYPSELGLVPGAGSILAAIEAASGVEPVIVGKPERHLYDAALARLGLPAARTAMIGDRLDTDILGGRRAGLKTVLVCTGIDSSETVERTGIVPDLVVDGLEELVRRWRATASG